MVKNRYENTVRGFTAKINKEQLRSLERNPFVKYIEQNRKIQGLSSSRVINPSQVINLEKLPAMGQTTPWGVSRVGGVNNGSGRTAWIIDSGIDLDHPDLSVDLGNAVSFVQGTSADDQHGHGTHVAGILAAKNNSKGVVGVAAGADVVPVKVLDQTLTYDLSDLLDAIDYVAGRAIDVDIINMSLGDPTNPSGTSIDDAVIAAANSGLRFVLAAGNEKQNTNNVSPARVEHPNVWTVSASKQNDSFAVSFSCNPNFGSNFSGPTTAPIEFAAPGNNILSTKKGGGTEIRCGTSMSAPHVAGILLSQGISSTVYENGFVTNDPDSDPDPIANTEPRVIDPTITASVQNDHPKLSFQGGVGAEDYEIYRRKEASGNWLLWTTISSSNNDYVDMITSDPELAVMPTYPNGPDGWIGYKVKSIHEDGFESYFSNQVYFEIGDGGIVPQLIDSNKN